MVLDTFKACNKRLTFSVTHKELFNGKTQLLSNDSMKKNYDCVWFLNMERNIWRWTLLHSAFLEVFSNLGCTNEQQLLFLEPAAQGPLSSMDPQMSWMRDLIGNCIAMMSDIMIIPDLSTSSNLRAGNCWFSFFFFFFFYCCTFWGFCATFWEVGALEPIIYGTLWLLS